MSQVVQIKETVQPNGDVVRKAVRAESTTVPVGKLAGFNFISIAPWLAATGQALIDLDEDKEEADDFAGELLIYAADVGLSVQAGEDIPPFPPALAKGTQGRITGVLKATLQVANPLLTFASFQVADPKARKVLKYVSQALSQLLANQPVSAFK